MNFEVKKISGKTGKTFIREHHYTGTCHNGPMCWALIDDGNIRGVCAFATPCSEAVRASVFGPEHKDRVTELHRLFTFDDLPRNAGTWFIARAFRGLLEYKPRYRGIISFADQTEGHVGTIYQASNFLYCGATGRERFYRDDEGRLRHRRQGGVNISPAEAKKRGWVSEMRAAKHRYLKIIGPDRGERRHYERLVQLDVQEAP